MSKSQKSMQPSGKNTKQPSPRTTRNYSYSPLGGEIETIDIALSMLDYSDKTLTRLIERIKSL